MLGRHVRRKVLACTGLGMSVCVVPGALLGPGNLARGSDLIVMRASGVTPARLCGWPGLAGNDGIRARDGDMIISVHGQSARVPFGGVRACKF